MTEILFISQFFPATLGSGNTGGTISNRNLLRTLARDHEVTVLSFDPAGDDASFADEPFRVVHRAAPTWRAPRLLLHWQPFVRQATRDLIRTNGSPDILIATTSTLAAFDETSPATKCLAVVRAFENFGLRCPWVPRHTRADLAKGAILRRFQDGRLMRRADGVLTNSAFMKSAIASRFGIQKTRIHILKQQVDFSPVFQSPPKDTVGFVHRGADKNIAHVVDLARRASDLSFLVYGHSSGLPADLPANMSVVGWTSDRARMFASASLWLVPSLWAEPFGRVSIEAQAAGRAVLVVNCGGLPETVADPRYLIDGFDVEAWLNRMRELLSLTDADIAEAGAHVRSAFSAAAHDESIRAAIEAIMNSSGTMT